MRARAGTVVLSLPQMVGLDPFPVTGVLIVGGWIQERECVCVHMCVSERVQGPGSLDDLAWVPRLWFVVCGCGLRRPAEGGNHLMLCCFAVWPA